MIAIIFFILAAALSASAWLVYVEDQYDAVEECAGLIMFAAIFGVVGWLL